MAWMFLVMARSSGEERGELRKSPDLGVLIIFHIERALLFFFQNSVRSSDSKRVQFRFENKGP